MANRNLNARQQQKHDTSSNFNSKNATYLEGEILIESDTGRVKIADGDTDYKTLPYTIGTRVPTDAKFTDTTYNKATDSSLGLVQVGYSTSGKNYAVTLDDSGNAYVNVPWTDSVANNPAITITQNGTSKGSFTLNQTSAETIDLTDTTYSVFEAATSSVAGSTGLVPAPAAGKQTSFLRGDGTWVIPSQPTVNNPTITIKQKGATKGTFTLNQSGDATIELTDANTTYAQATSTVLGLVKIGYAENGRNYPIKLDSLGKMFVNVPWTDTTYSVFEAATSSVAGSTGLVPAPAAGKQTSFLRGDGTWVIPSQPTVNNPTITIKQKGATKGTFTLNQSGDATIELTDANTTYAQATSTVLGLVKIGYAENGRNYPIKLDSLGKMFVNVPWTDTTYSVATVSEDGLMPKIPSSSAQYLNGMGQWSTPPDTKYTNFVGSGSKAKSGLVPSPGTIAGTTKYLREDGTWSVPPDTTYTAGRAIEISQGAISVTSSGVSSGAYGLTDSTSVNIGTSFTVPGFVVDQCGRLTQAYSRTVTVNAPNMTGATTSAAGTAGLVPTPTAGKPTRYLCSTGEWSIPTGTIYNGSTTISVKPSTTDGEYNIYLVALFPGTTSQSVGPSASGTINFGSAFNVPYITIDQYGRITALANRSMILSGALASRSAPGLCPKLDSSHPSYYLNANGNWSLPRGRVYGVKGEAETDYREGQVNITAANVGALALTGGTVSGSTTFSNNVTINGELNYDGGFY